jgi:hypothetical protein
MAAQVTVCCKLPHGLTMRLFDMVEIYEQVLGGGSRAVKVAQERKERVTVNGFSYAQNVAPHCKMTGGYAITTGVDKEFWDAWLAQNKDSDVVKNFMIFAHENGNSAQAQANEHAKEYTGVNAMERLDPENLKGSVKQSDLMKKKVA